MPSSPDSLSCASWLVYATRATDQAAQRVRNLILQIKTDRVDVGTAVPMVRLVIERAVERLDDQARAGFEGSPVLVPVPGAGLTKPNSVWPSRRVCEELVRQGIGEDVLAIIRRSIAVPKSAGSADRPDLDQHVQSLSIQSSLRPPSRLLIVDDVVTSGTTIMACAIRLAQTFPGVPIAGFALARVQSTGNPARVFDPVVESIFIDGLRCRRSVLR